MAELALGEESKWTTARRVVRGQSLRTEGAILLSVRVQSQGRSRHRCTPSRGEGCKCKRDTATHQNRGAVCSMSPQECGYN